MSDGWEDELCDIKPGGEVMELEEIKSNELESSDIAGLGPIETNDADAYTKGLQKKLENSNSNGFSRRNNSNLKIGSRRLKLIRKKKRETSNASKRQIIRAVKRLRKKSKKSGKIILSEKC